MKHLESNSEDRVFVPICDGVRRIDHIINLRKIATITGKETFSLLPNEIEVVAVPGETPVIK